ncbi:hypothetical protein T02_15527 [Trichinella nativa]|uniref:Uncharacterized protein n=1 Tax=Trichinella nativa TaxID=6335 RepID=A0A0V1L7M1_9BILA|nr:hypothetical protein T02_15527 [Trichinella nativa]
MNQECNMQSTGAKVGFSSLKILIKPCPNLLAFIWSTSGLLHPRVLRSAGLSPEIPYVEGRFSFSLEICFETMRIMTGWMDGCSGISIAATTAAMSRIGRRKLFSDPTGQ